MDEMMFHKPDFCCAPCYHHNPAFCYKMPLQHLNTTHKPKGDHVWYQWGSVVHRSYHKEVDCHHMVEQIEHMGSDHSLLKEVAGSAYVLHAVENLHVVLLALHAIVSSSADTAPGSLSRSAPHAQKSTVGKPASYEHICIPAC